MNDDKIITSLSEKERSVKPVAIVFAILAWMGVAISIVGLIYAPFIALGVMIAQALWFAHINGNGVKLGPQQLPHLWKKVVDASARLGLATPPDTYILQAGGALNAFASKVFTRNFVVLYSDLIEASDDDALEGHVTELDFIVAHEVAHLARGHLVWWLLPVRAMPLLGAAYSRACEYTWDQNAHEVVKNLEVSSRALAILAGGKRSGKKLDLDAFVAQSNSTSGFFSAIYELNATHPYLPKRVHALRKIAGAEGVAPIPARSVFSYVLAPMFNVSFAIAVYLIFIVAVLAVPAFKKFQEQATAAALEAPSQDAANAAERILAEQYAHAAKTGIKNGVLHGAEFNYTLRVPTGWVEAGEEVEGADRTVSRATNDAHISVFVGETTASLDAATKAELRNFPGAKNVKQSALTLKGTKASLLNFRVKLKDVSIEYYTAVAVKNGYVFSIVAYADVGAITSARQDLLSAINSFEPGGPIVAAID